MRTLPLLFLLLAGACGAQSGAPPAPPAQRVAAPPPAAVKEPAPTAALGPPASARIARIERGLPPPVKIKGEQHLYSLENRMRELKIRAISIAVFENYTVQWTHTWGQADAESGAPATDDTVFLAGSISKSVNALAALLAVADGTLSLDAPINDSLASWKLPDNELTRASPVTLRRLLSHTAGTTVHGFPGYVAGTPLPTVPQILDGAPPANTPAVRVDLAPGTRFRYSGGGTTIVQLALVDRTKRPYPELLQERVLGPLEMTHSTFRQVPAPETAAVGYRRDGNAIPGKRNAYPEMAAAGLWTTAGDLARFFAEVARARTGASRHIPREVAVQMTTPVIESGPGDSVALGVFVRDRNGTTMFGHGGADEGFQANAVASLDGGFGYVVMVSSDNGTRIFDQIEDAVFDEYGWPGRTEPIERIEADPKPFLGRYLAGGQPFTIAIGGKLQLRRPFEDPVELVPIDPSTVVALDDGMRYRLDPAGAGLQTERRGRPGPAVKRVADGERVPLLELEAGRFDAAVAAWRAIEKQRPKDPTIDEDAMNVRGYTLLGRGQTDAAIRVLALIAAAHPGSANAHDSLGEAYAATGDKRRAIAEYELARARLAADDRIRAADKAQFGKRIDEILAKLRAP